MQSFPKYSRNLFLSRILPRFNAISSTNFKSMSIQTGPEKNPFPGPGSIDFQKLGERLRSDHAITLKSDPVEAKRFTKSMIKHHKITTYSELLKDHPQIIVTMFQAMGPWTKMELFLADYLFRNLAAIDYNGEVIKKAVQSSQVFCNNVIHPDTIDLKIFETMSPNTFYLMLNNASNKSKKLFFKYMLKNKKMLSKIPLFINMAQGIDILSSEHIDSVIHQNQLDQLAKLSSLSGLLYWYNPMLTDPVIRVWENFALDNMQYLFATGNQFLFDRLICIGSLEFKQRFVDKVIENDIHPGHFEKIMLLYNGSDLEKGQWDKLFDHMSCATIKN